MLPDDTMRELADRLTSIDGVVGVTLGGSRSRGTHLPSSDVDLGVYYRADLDIDGLGALAREVAGPQAGVSDRGGWGPWVDGGAWLSIDHAAVDWIYRDLDRVESIWADAQAGRYAIHLQLGHPLGFPDFAYVGEIALGRVLTDPSGVLTTLQAAMSVYPPVLREAVSARALGEAEFLVTGAGKARARRDTVFIAGCLFQVIGLLAHAVHAHAGRWLINEKGAVDATVGLPGAPPDFDERAYGVIAGLSRNPAELDAALEAARRLVADTRRGCAPSDR